MSKNPWLKEFGHICLALAVISLFRAVGFAFDFGYLWAGALVYCALWGAEEIAWFPRRKYHVPWIWRIPTTAAYYWGGTTPGCPLGVYWILMRHKGWIDLAFHFAGAWGAVIVWGI